MQCPSIISALNYFPLCKRRISLLNLNWCGKNSRHEISNLSQLQASVLALQCFRKKEKKVENKPHPFSAHLFQSEARDYLHEKEK